MMTSNKRLVDLAPLFKRLRLSTVYEHLNELLEDAEIMKMGKIDLLYTLLETEVARRDANAITRRLKESKCPILDATITNVDFAAERKLDRDLILSLASCYWIEKHQNCIITGKTGCGKTWLAGAFVNAACCLGYTAYFIRVPALVNELRELTMVPKEKLSFQRKLRTVDLLVLDDWGYGKFDDMTRSDLFEIIEHRRGKCSTLITSVLPVSGWANYIKDVHYSDAILDRLVYNSHRIEIEGPSMRSRPEYGAVISK